MSWLPRFETARALTYCEDDHEYEGREVNVIWGVWIVSFTIAKRWSR